MTLIEQRAAGRPGPCRICKGRRSCRSAVAQNCPAFLAWTAVPWEQRVWEEYRAHLRWMMKQMRWEEHQL